MNSPNARTKVSLRRAVHVHCEELRLYSLHSHIVILTIFFLLILLYVGFFSLFSTNSSLLSAEVHIVDVV